MFQDTRPAALGADGHPDAWGEFRVDHPREILALMRQLRDGAVPVNLNAPDGRTLGTTVWAVDDGQERLNFQVEPDRPELAWMIEADEIVAVAYLDSVKLQFELNDPMLVHGSQMVALQTRMPRELYRFQRRGAYRVRTLDRSSPTAHVRHPAMPDMVMPLRVIDVSIGGCALVVPHDVPPLDPGTLITGVRVELDAETRFETGLQLQHVTSLMAGPKAVRVGCEWRQLGGNAERALQRYIDQTQKRRRLLSLD